MESLSELWISACVEIWELAKDRPLIRDTATLWDAFRYLYMQRIPPTSMDKVNVPEE